MDAESKKTALRMIPYGIYVLTTQDAAGQIAAATVNWVTQTAFVPPLVAVAVKADSGAYATLKEAGTFALNMLGKGQQPMAFAFFKPTQVADGKLSGHAYRAGTTGAPLLTDAAAAVECRLTDVIERGDHHLVLGEVVAAYVHRAPEGRPDAGVLEMKDLGEKVFYGG